MLDYTLTVPTSEDEDELLQGENALIANINSPASKNTDGNPSENQTLLITVATHQHVLVVPIKWEKSITKVGMKICTNRKIC